MTRAVLVTWVTHLDVVNPNPRHSRIMKRATGGRTERTLGDLLRRICDTGHTICCGKVGRVEIGIEMVKRSFLRGKEAICEMSV